MTLMAISGMSISCRVSPANQPLPTASDGQMQVTPSAAELENRTEPVVITFACPGWIKSEIKEVAGSFEDSYPDIRVHLVTVEEIAQFGQDVNYEDTIRQIVSSADAAQWLPTPLASREGMLLNLTPYIESDNSFDTNDIYAPMLDSVQWDGGTWALPSKGTLALLYYDKNAFDDATLEYPTLDWTLDDFLTAAQLLTLWDGETVTQYGFVDYANGLLSASVTSEFSEARNDTGEFTVPQLTNPVISSAMKWYVDLALEYGVMPNPQTLSSSENGRYQALHSLVHGDIADKESNGIAAMWTDLLSNYTMNTNLHGRVGIAPIPGRNHALPFSLWESYIVSAGTQHPEETWRWLTYLIQHPISGPPVVANDIPAYRPTAEQSYWVRWTDEEKAVIKHSLENAMILKVKDVAGAVRSAANAVFSGETVDAALLVAQESVTESYQTLMQAQPIHIAVSTPVPEKPGVSTITFATTHTSEHEQLATVFHETYPDIRVNIIRPDAGEYYDCFVAHRDVTQDHGRDGILNIQPLIEAEADFPLSEFHPRSLEALQYKGDLWGIPSQATAIAIFYNRDLFDAMDLAYPKPGWTIEDFQETATKLTQSTDIPPFPWTLS
jgi:ABC-type glycerol-3-phosphate transport system substrate-binding protein